MLTRSIAFASVFTAVIITMIAVGIQKPGTGSRHYTLWSPPDHPIVFWKAFLSVTNIVFAYGESIVSIVQDKMLMFLISWTCGILWLHQ